MDERKDGAKVESLEERRQMKLLKQHQEGEAFAFEHYAFRTEGIGTNDLGVTVILNEEELLGIFMAPEDAEALGIALIQAAAVSRLEKDGVIEYVEQDSGPDAS